MDKIVISGYYGFGNAGDEAMLAALLEALLEVIPDADITVISGNPEMTAKAHGVKAIGRFHMTAIIEAIRQSDLLISGGGSLLQDVTSSRSLYYYVTIIRLATLLGKKVMIYAQGIGPLRGSLARMAVGSVLNHVHMITVRDERSKEELLSLGVTKPPIQVTADAVLSMHPVDSNLAKRLVPNSHTWGVRPKIGVSVRQWKTSTAYRSELAKALDALSKAYHCHILFIPMQHPDDTREAKAIQALMKEESLVLEETFTTTELLALSGSMDLLIGVRLHALVFSALMEKPLVGITYDPKITNFLKMIGEEPVGDLDSVKAESIIERASTLLDQGKLPSSTLARVRTLREESLQNAHIALGMLHKESM